MSGVRDYIVEVFRLKPINRDERLVEKTPLEAEFTEVVKHVEEEMTLTYTPNEPGMYMLFYNSFYQQEYFVILMKLYIFMFSYTVILHTVT